MVAASNVIEMDGEKSACADGEERREYKLDQGDQDYKRATSDGSWDHLFTCHLRYLTKEGEYLVRTQEKHGGLQFVVTVKTEKRFAHFIITYKEKGGWALAVEPTKAFGTIVELIDYYAKNKLPGENGMLQQPFQKPKWFIRHENITYDIDKDLIGAGNFCDVFRGKLYGKIAVALKVCHGPTGEKQSPDEIAKMEDAKDSLIREASLMAQFKHPNVVKFHGICCDVPPVCIVMERCTGGSLDTHLQQWTDKIQTAERILYSLEAAKGMCYLQENHLIHRDLAARNCLISKYGIIKIADFGLSKLVNDLAGESLKQKVPVRWMAPETIRKEPQYSSKSDAWSFGVLVYEIYNNGIKPWPDLDVRRCATYIRQGNMPELPDRTPPEVADLVSECWTVDVEKRCDFKHIVTTLTSILNSYGTPKPADMTLSKLENVKTLSEKEAEAEEEKSERERESLSKKTPESPLGEEGVRTMFMKIVGPEAEFSVASSHDKKQPGQRPPHTREVLARKRQKEREAEFFNENLLECIEDEIKKLLILKQSRRRRKKHKTHRKGHRHHHKRKGRRSSEDLRGSLETTAKTLSREDTTATTGPDDTPRSKEQMQGSKEGQKGKIRSKPSREDTVIHDDTRGAKTEESESNKEGRRGRNRHKASRKDRLTRDDTKGVDSVESESDEEVPKHKRTASKRNRRHGHSIEELLKGLRNKKKKSRETTAKTLETEDSSNSQRTIDKEKEKRKARRKDSRKFRRSSEETSKDSKDEIDKAKLAQQKKPAVVAVRKGRTGKGESLEAAMKQKQIESKKDFRKPEG